MLTLSLNLYRRFALRVRTLLLALFAVAMLFSASASAQQAPKPIAGSAVTATIVNTTNKVPDTADVVAVTVGRSVLQGSQIAGKEALKNGDIVGCAVPNFTAESWNLLKGSCRAVGRKAAPVNAYFQGANRINDTLTVYGAADKNNTVAIADLAGKANVCFEQVQDGYYCAFPKELEQVVSQAGAIFGNRINLATKIFKEASSKDCLPAGDTSAVGNMSAAVCALGKVVVTDAQRAFACFAAAESKGVMKKFFTPGAASHAFPSTEACEGIGELTFTVAVKVATSGFGAEAKAAKAAGKSNTVALVADELRMVYKVAAPGARYEQIVAELEALPECRQ